MRKFNTLFALCSLLFLFFFTACEEDEAIELTPESEAPSISVLSPEKAVNNEYFPTVGETLTFTIWVEDETGLSQVFLNGDPIRTYMEEVKVDTITYDLRIRDLEAKELLFSVEDGWRNRHSTATLTVFPVPVEIPEINPDEIPLYVLLDFAGGMVESETKTVNVEWDIRTLYTFNVEADHTQEATAEVVHSQAQLSFAVANPEGSEEVMKFVKQPMSGFDNWGGWVNLIFNLQTPLHEGFVTALPQYDAASTSLTPGTKVVKLDVYYDATVDPAYGWDDVTAFNEDGYEVDLVLANYDKMANQESGYDNNGYYIAYTDYITEPNQWVTLTFEVVDEETIDKFGGASATEVDAINIRPARGYSGDDKNPLFIKNLRIVDVE